MNRHRNDVTLACRMLLRQPGFTAIALLTLALSIGATTAIFSVVNGIVLRPLPFPESDRLVLLFEKNVERGWMTFSVAPANFVDWARGARTFESMVAMTYSSAALTSDQGAEQVPATFATAELFRVLKGTPALGRTFVAGDDAPGAAPVAVIGHGLWQRRFGSDPATVGRVVTINDLPVTIVGIMKPGFGEGRPDTDLWLPLTIDRQRAERGGRSLSVVGRLAEGATLDRARTELDRLASELAREYPAENGGWGTTLIPLEEVAVSSGVKNALYLLLSSVAFVLLIGCVNVANLLSARGVARQREFVIRAAVGASRFRLIRQLLTESAVLAGAGDILGLFVAVWGIELLQALAPAALPRVHEVGLDGRVLAVSLMTTAAASLIFGLVPALQFSAARPDEALKETQRGTATPRRKRVSQLLVVAEIALAVVLLVGAGLFLRSFVRLSTQPIGFDPAQKLAFSLSLPESRYRSPQSVSAFHRSALERIRALPGVVAAGASHSLPFSGRDSVRPFMRANEPADGSNPPVSEYRIVTPGYFAAMGIPMVRGREFTNADAAGRPGAIIVSESFAAKFLQGDPIGQRIRQAGDPDLPWLTVVGVAGDVRHFGLAAEMRPEMFWPEAQAIWGATLNRHRRGLTYVVRATGDPLLLLPTIRAQIAELDPNRPVIDPRRMSDLVARSADVARFSTVLLTIFASTGLALAAAGVYGLMSFGVSSRRREMGIRLALGAHPRDLLADVLRSGLRLALAGGAIGLAAAWLLSDALDIRLFQTAAHDGFAFLSAAALLLLTAVAACLVPARRAGRLDPIEALRE
jgi:putative ABC transport system permease protein